jgi:hypothetical protein
MRRCWSTQTDVTAHRDDSEYHWDTSHDRENIEHDIGPPFAPELAEYARILGQSPLLQATRPILSFLPEAFESFLDDLRTKWAVDPTLELLERYAAALDPANQNPGPTLIRDLRHLAQMSTLTGVAVVEDESTQSTYSVSCTRNAVIFLCSDTEELMIDCDGPLDLTGVHDAVRVSGHNRTLFTFRMGSCEAPASVDWHSRADTLLSDADLTAVDIILSIYDLPDNDTNGLLQILSAGNYLEPWLQSKVCAFLCACRFKSPIEWVEPIGRVVELLNKEWIEHVWKLVTPVTVTEIFSRLGELSTPTQAVLAIVFCIVNGIGVTDGGQGMI